MHHFVIRYFSYFLTTVVSRAVHTHHLITGTYHLSPTPVPSNTHMGRKGLFCLLEFACLF